MINRILICVLVIFAATCLQPMPSQSRAPRIRRLKFSMLRIIAQTGTTGTKSIQTPTASRRAAIAIPIRMSKPILKSDD